MRSEKEPFEARIDTHTHTCIYIYITRAHGTFATDKKRWTFPEMRGPKGGTHQTYSIILKIKTYSGISSMSFRSTIAPKICVGCILLYYTKTL